LIKPDPAIFYLLVNRFKLAPERTLFVDHSSVNIEAAQALGFLVHHFTDTTTLRPHLMELGLLEG
jgi:HAD superfamily hydrolase (TIGR01509 family)